MKFTIAMILMLAGVVAHAKKFPALVSVSDARIIAPLKGTNVTAGYAVFKNEMAEAASLSIIEAKPFKAVETHETFETDGKTGMRKIEKITIPAHEVFELKPGGNHIMLFDPTRMVKVGETVPVSFSVNGKKMVVMFKVVARGEAAH